MTRLVRKFCQISLCFCLLPISNELGRGELDVREAAGVVDLTTMANFLNFYGRAAGLD